MKKLKWHTEKRQPAQLIGLSYNPRKLTPTKKKKLEQSLKRFGLVDIPVINLDNTVISGNQRMQSLIDLGRGSVDIDVRVPNRQLSEKEVKEYAIIANTHAGEFDIELLDTHFSDIDFDDLGFDVGLVETFDFDKKEIKNDDYQAPKEIKTTIKRGDLIEFYCSNGSYHRLLCGDSTKEEDFEKLMQDQHADLLITDPPYGVSYADKNKYLNAIAKGNRIQKNIENDHKTPAQMAEFWLTVFSLCATYLKKVSSYYVFAANKDDLFLEISKAIKQSSLLLKHLIIWVKNNHVLGRTDYNYKHEPIIYGWLKNGSHKFYGGFNTSVLNFDKPLKNDLHPTMKPVPLIAKLIQNSSLKGMIILDVFLGSGTTLIASIETKRNCYGIEYDEKYCQVILDRVKRLDQDCQIKINGKEWN